MNYPKEYTVKEWKKFNHEIKIAKLQNNKDALKSLKKELEAEA